MISPNFVLYLAFLTLFSARSAFPGKLFSFEIEKIVSLTYDNFKVFSLIVQIFRFVISFSLVTILHIHDFLIIWTEKSKATRLFEFFIVHIVDNNLIEVERR